MQNKSNIITIFQDGESKHLKSYSTRLESFLAQYPPMSGWAIQTEGKIIPPITTGDEPAIQFDAYLVDPQGQKRTNRSSLGKLSVNKAWQKTETNACSRLLAALGFGSEVFDEEEIEDFLDHGYQVSQGIAPKNAPAQEPSKVTTVQAVSQTPNPVDDATDVDKSNNEHSSTKVDAATEPEAKPALIKTPQRTANNGIPKVLMSNLKRMAIQLGKTVPELTTKSEAEALLKEYLAEIQDQANHKTEDTEE